MRAATKHGARQNGRHVAVPKSMRVAVYCRQSVDRSEGGEFGSIEAQRECVEAFIGSKRAFGWQTLPTSYEDLGFSGATVQRPEFQRLLADIGAGKVDVVAVYRLDRFSRSLLDFARLMVFLQEKGVEFASVSEQFDTSSPMGRMVLNLLATFAQFERETIAQRTRDKIQATRRRGGWTGGQLVLGYDSENGRLLVNESEAEIVRAIFATYRTEGSLLAVVDEAERRGWTTKSWTSTRGRAMGGKAITKSVVYYLLQNPLYAGRIRAGDDLVDGAHDAIIDPALFAAVQRQLKAHGKGRRAGTWARPHPAWLLLGLVRCARCGSAMSCQSTRRGARKHRYYVCSKIAKGRASLCPGSRACASDLETAVVERLLAIGEDSTVLDAVIAADRAQREQRIPVLQADLRKLRAQAGHLEEQRRNLLDSIQEGRPGSVALAGRVDQVSAAIDDAHVRIEAAMAELDDLDGGAIDQDELARVLRDLGRVWAAMLPIERSRVVSLLVERVDVDVPGGEMEIRFRPGAPATLQRHGGEVVR